MFSGIKARREAGFKYSQVSLYLREISGHWAFLLWLSRRLLGTQVEEISEHVPETAELQAGEGGAHEGTASHHLHDWACVPTQANWVSTHSRAITSKLPKQIFIPATGVSLALSPLL